ncbi:hypothetical protein [Streptomyces sp. SID12488]|uniref:hypothetical protein n=1 Tax=Streptomyces sp. SID12488 TaxID=2706040 RepID=UPI0013DAF249|nr:hypothetical protein [Streptomyces sp. SID12488]NEA61331.1 hypothetical protein [Streptomyces sp. SID12488]
MTTETTHHTDHASPVSVQRSAVQVLADLIDQHPELPAAHVTIYKPFGGKAADLHLSVDTPHRFELWRTALGIAPSDVALYVYAGDSWLAAQAIRAGIDIKIATHGIAMTDEQVNAPRDAQGVTA